MSGRGAASGNHYAAVTGKGGRAASPAGGPDNDAALIRAELQSRIVELIAAICPDFHAAQDVRGGIARPLNPTRNDRKKGSFCIRVQGDAAGQYIDFATDERGDVIGLVKYCLRHGQYRDTFAWCREWLGFGTIGAAERTMIDARRTAKRIEEKQASADDRDKHRAHAFGLWTQGAAISGTAVETYLSWRGIDLDRLAKPPGILRCLPSHRHTESGQTWPVMAAGLVRYNADGGGAQVGIHRTFLAADGRGKAPVTPTKKIWPAGWEGGVIPLAQGENRCALREALSDGLVETLALCEGIEDGLTLALAQPKWRVWAVGTLGNLAHVTLPVNVGELIVAQDNDWGKPQAERAFQFGVDRLARQGVRVAVIRAGGGAKDFNEQLMRERERI